MILLLVFSGNPITRFFGVAAVLIAAIFVILTRYSHIKRAFFGKISVICVALLALFILQYLTLNFVSWLGAFRYMSLFIFGGLVFSLVGERFSYTFFIVIFYLSLISLVGFVVVNLLNVHPPGVVWGLQRVTYVVYTFVEEHHYRNSGMFWEPGAFAGILILCIALNIRNIPELWKNHKLKILVIIIALLTTKSTTGYITFFLIVIYYLLFFVRIAIIKIVVIPAIFLTIFLVYESAPFLQAKISTQSQKSQSIVYREFANTRIGSFLLDWHYIQKHPLVGNGLNEITRYADDPLLVQRIQAGENIANANGFSNFLACLGIPFMFLYLLSCFLTMSKVNAGAAALIVFVIVFSLWGEQWLNFPIFAGIMFLDIRKYTGSAAKRFNRMSYA